MRDLENIRDELREFARERDWEQFHTPKNLAMALCGEAGELAEIFQWLGEAESAALDPERLARVSDEVADIQIYLIRLADRLGIDLREAVERKMEQNRRKYPADKVRGSARKYNEYPEEKGPAGDG